MAGPRIANRMGRYGRNNPGRKHLKGKDVTAKMQRQYEHILESARKHRRYGSDKKRKSVAAATTWKQARRNPLFGLDDEERAEQLAEEFHGRPVREILEVTEEEAYDDFGAILGFLQKLCILMEDDSYIPIDFDYEPGSEDNVLVASNPEGTNIEFVGGDQDIDWQYVDGATAEKNLVLVGPVFEIDYFADKHHLSGPKEQKSGITYYHEFGEDDGELPYLVFDRRNTKLLFVGGSYTVEPEGITG